MTHFTTVSYYQQDTEYPKEQINFKQNTNVEELISRYNKSPALLIEAAKQNAHFAIDKLIACGYDINYQDHEGNTALHYAAKHLSYSSVWKLISFGADLTIENNNGKKAESLLGKQKSKNSHEVSESLGNEAENCKKFFTISKYTDYIIFADKIHFSKKDADIVNDIRFSTLLIRKMWNKIEKEGIIIPTEVPDKPAFLKKINSNIDKFVSKMDINNKFSMELKSCLLEEWKGRIEKQKEANKILLHHDIWSITLIKDEEIQTIVKKMQGHEQLKEGLEKLKQTPISLQDREKIKKIEEAYNAKLTNKYFKLEEDCSDQTVTVKSKRADSEPEYQKVVNELSQKLEPGKNSIDYMKLPYIGLFSELPSHFQECPVNRYQDAVKKNLNYLFSLVENADFTTDDFLLKFLKITNDNLMFLIDQHTTLLHDEQLDSVDLVGIA